jgi:hypothetical protein
MPLASRDRRTPVRIDVLVEFVPWRNPVPRISVAVADLLVFVAIVLVVVDSAP